MKRLLVNLALLLAAAQVQAASGVVGSMVPDGTTITCDASGVCTATAGGGGGTPGGSTNDIQYKSGGSTFGGITLADGQLVVGQTGAVPLAQTISGDVTLTAGGAIAIGAAKVTNAMLAGSIDLTTKVTGILPGANGGTGNGFFAVSGPATSLRTFTFPNASATVLTSNAAVTVAQGGTGAATLAAHGVVVGAGTSAVAVTGAGTSGQVLTSNGASADPTFQAAAGGTSKALMFGAGSIASGTKFIAVSGAVATEANAPQIPVIAGTLKNFQASQNAATGSGATYTYTLRVCPAAVSCADSTLTFTISGASATTGIDNTHTVTVSTGDTIDVKTVSSGSPASPTIGWSVELDPS